MRSIPESRFLVLLLACVFSLNPIFGLLVGRGNTKGMGFRFTFKAEEHKPECQEGARTLALTARLVEVDIQEQSGQPQACT